MMQGKLLLLLFIAAAAAAAAEEDLLQNADFESPPLNVTANSTTPFVLLTQTNTIPGWTFNGTVQYVTAGPNMSLPGNGHAIQLGTDGKINQTFRANGTAMDYVLTFSLAAGGENCSTSTTVNVSVPGRSSLVALEQRYGSEEWESHACYLGRWGANSGPINLNLRSQPSETDPNITCGPVVDTFILKAIGMPVEIQDNLLINGGFEVGPAFVTNSTEGILLEEEIDFTQSALQQWSVMGIVKYIDSKHFLVPQGNAAIEIVSGDISGVRTTVALKKGSTYNLEFVMGDTNNSCTGNFIVGAQGGPSAQNFTLQSNGMGTTQKFSMVFKADSNPTPISFTSFTQGQTKDFAFCGPVIDDVVLRAASCGLKSAVKSGVLFSCIVFIVSALNILG
ncbi:protein DUF642 L-GALACTONO-1,4-LACTONE-RESPONSIVE GENE 2-like [Magnolia sinica]|uniref:protein DUF642 L-GALACTONO-1,4-LACTONE-RESPONSIVE GENE 2-like n=1 Tax=Magnolia sinica TaxID=86752 RepID=UPI00265A4A1D|nr:protein DUF642 L-GALACTONO-1,4-LACTONE-RESPONSIVE GENE 2-like [Magnolia sinica]